MQAQAHKNQLLVCPAVLEFQLVSFQLSVRADQTEIKPALRVVRVTQAP